MKHATGADGTLQRAFRRFERAALSLEERHGALHDEVERLERRLVDANRRLEAVVDAVDGGVAVVSADGRLLRTNPAFDRLELGDATGGLKPDALRQLLETDVSHGGSARMHHPTSHGTRDLAATLVPVDDEEGTRVLTVRDVTEIRREQEEGGRRQRLEALGRMAAELAHEVRNPLGSIRLHACMLQDDLAGQPDKRGMTEQILAATAGLEGTVSNLLAFAAPPRGARRQLDLARLASDVCGLFEPACSVRGVSLEGPDPGKACLVAGDPEGLRQVVLNLLGNALAATEAGGSIRVEVLQREDRVMIDVTDDGQGIAIEDLARVFDPFFSRTVGGTGLGLSIVHRTVERHGGRITLDSRPGGGTRAQVDLPVAEVEAHV